MELETCYKKTFSKAIDKEILQNENAIIHFITTPDIDEGKEIMNPMGMDSSYFDLTKSVFYMHQYMNPPIAKNVMLNPTRDGVIAKTVFGKTEFATDIYNLHKEGIINTWSIGFDYNQDDSEVKKDIRTINKWKLFEYSSAPFPMNANAGDIAKSLKSFELKSLIKEMELKQTFESQLQSQKKQIDNLERIIIKQVATEVQTLIFSKDKFTKDDAVTWCEDHDFRHDKIDETENSYRFRQFDPSACTDNSERTIELTDGVKAVVCKKKSLSNENEDLLKEKDNLKSENKKLNELLQKYRIQLLSNLEPKKISSKEMLETINDEFLKIAGRKLF